MVRPTFRDPLDQNLTIRNTIHSLTLIILIPHLAT